MKEAVIPGVLAVILFAATVSGVGGFDTYGYNEKASIFVGTGLEWCEPRTNDPSACEEMLGPRINDRLIINWNEGWELGMAEEWANPPYNAWIKYIWNGKYKGGSGEIWHYKIEWTGSCRNGEIDIPKNGICINDEFVQITTKP